MNEAVRTPLVDEIRRRTRKIQKLLTLQDPEPAVAEEPPAVAVPRKGPPPCRAALAQWPVEWRERWGRLANALEESGLPWREAEARAFVEVWKQRRAESKSQPIPLPGGDAERN